MASPSSHRWRLRDPRILARVAAGGGNLEAREVVIPAVRVGGDRLRARKVLVHEADARAVALGHQFDLDRGRARGDARLAFPAPGEDEPVRRVELDELASSRMAGDHLAVV